MGQRPAPLLHHQGSSRPQSREFGDPPPAPQKAPLPLPGSTSPLCPKTVAKGDLSPTVPVLQQEATRSSVPDLFLIRCSKPKASSLSQKEATDKAVSAALG